MWPVKSGTAFEKARWVLSHQGPLELLKRTWNYTRKYGIKGLWQYRSGSSAYRAWMKKEAAWINDILKRAPQDIDGFSYRPVISIIMPVWNTKAEYLEKAIQSVLNQAYPFWQLCIADDASTEPHVGSILYRYKETDGRINVITLSRQEGIVGASNKAISLAKGEFAGLLDHDDELAPHALLEVVRHLNKVQDADVIYSDEDRIIGDGKRCDPFFKPDWSPDLLLSMNYIGHFMAVRRTLLDKAGGFLDGTDGSQDHDLILRISALTDKIVHVPMVLYHWRFTPGSVSNTEDSRVRAYRAGGKAVEEALKSRNLEGQVTVIANGRYRVQYSVKGDPLVSIIIPTRNRKDLLQRCIDSIIRKSSYKNYEIIVVDNGSTDENTLAYLHDIAGLPENCRVLPVNEPFNFSRINNFAVREARGGYLLFLNNDTEVITSDWLEEMLSHTQRPEVGVVGAKLLFPNRTIQHGGIILGIGGVAGHAFYSLPEGNPGYMDFLTVTRNCSAVTAACMMVRKEVFDRVGGFDSDLEIAYNDVDLCLRILEKGYSIVWTPYAVLLHYESASRGYSLPAHNIEYFSQKWSHFINRGDPYYNKNLTLNHCDYKVGN